MKAKILDKYIVKQILANTGICILVFTVIYLVVDFFEKIDDFMEAKVTSTIIAKYFFYKLAFIINQMFPVAVLIAVIIVFGFMKKNKELIALQASGIGIKRTYIPALTLGLFFVILSFLLSELLVPHASSKAESLWIKEVRKGRYKRFFRRRHIWYKGKNCIFWIEKFDGKRNLMEKAVFYFLNKRFQVIKRIQAKEVIWKNGFWLAKDVILQTKKNKGRGYNLIRLPQMQIIIPETPASFLRPIRKPEEMNYWQLKRFAEQIQKEGYDARRYFVDSYVKLSFPFMNLVVVIIGIPAALRIKKESIPISISIGILVCFIYILLMGIFRSLGISGVLPPIMAAWMANVILFLYGTHLMLHID